MTILASLWLRTVIPAWRVLPPHWQNDQGSFRDYGLSFGQETCNYVCWSCFHLIQWATIKVELNKETNYSTKSSYKLVSRAYFVSIIRQQANGLFSTKSQRFIDLVKVSFPTKRLAFSKEILRLQPVSGQQGIFKFNTLECNLLIVYSIIVVHRQDQIETVSILQSGAFCASS